MVGVGGSSPLAPTSILLGWQAHKTDPARVRFLFGENLLGCFQLKILR